MINLISVLRSLNLRCYGNQLIWGQTMNTDRYHLLLLEFYKELEYRHPDKRIHSGDDAAASCKNLVNFGPVTAEITLLSWVSLYGL